MAELLVVDDDPDTLQLLHAVLHEAGHEVLLAWNGEDALALYRRYRPELVDIFMPYTDGLEVIQTVRRDSRQARIIAISAGGSLDRRDVLRTAKDLGANVTIQKPLDPAVVVKAVETLLGHP